MRFTYRALKDNKIIIKKIEAENEEEVVHFLKSENMFPVEIKRTDSASQSFVTELFDRVTFADIVDLTRQLAIMLNAGLTLIDCFDILKKQLTKPSLLKLVDQIDKEVKGGSSFSESLKLFPNYFPNLYISLVKSGEASGKLSEILLKLSDNLEKQREFQSKMKGALIYPAIIVVGMIGVMFVMITFVLPKLLDLYKDFDIELPLTTQILIAVSSFSIRFWPVILAGVFFGSIAVSRYLKTQPGRLMKDTLMLRLPVIKNVVRMSALVDTTRTLSILINAGVSILEGLSIVIETTDNMVYRKAFQNVYKQVEKGSSIGNALTNEQIFPPLLIQMTTVGEQTGHLDETLGRVSTYYEMETNLAVKAMTTLIEPLILVFLGIGVGFLVMSVITPIYNLTTSFK